MTSNTVVDEFLPAIANAAIPGCEVWSGGRWPASLLAEMKAADA